jgi:hypothetical protein
MGVKTGVKKGVSLQPLRIVVSMFATNATRL